MSLIGHIGSSQGQSQVQESRAVAAPPAPPAESAPNPLASIQNLVKQLETSANTQAIPAHQNW